MGFSATSRQRFRPGDTLIATSDDSADAYIIERGEVAVWRETADGRTLLARLGEGQMVGELSLIDGEGRTATVTALTECTVRVVTTEDLTNHLEGVHPIIHTLIDALLERIRATDRAARGFALPGLPAASPKHLSPFAGCVRDGALQLHHTPVTDLRTGRVQQFRSTVVWVDDDHGHAPASELLKTEPAGDTLGELTSWMLLRATADCTALRQRAGAAAGVAVALSEQQLLGDSLVDDVFAAVSNACLAPEALTLEVHEADLPEPGTRVAERLMRCVEGGVRLAVSHFGQRLAPIARLIDLPIQQVLIDPNLLRDAAHAQTLVAALLGMATDLQLTVTAQAIQTPDQAERARRAGIQRIHSSTRNATDAAGIRSARSSLDVSPDDGLVIDGLLDQPASLAG
ncbi:MAG: EAL domain-containing protein [Abyssibacter sp.]|uniref:EAL domain-containing protein n=1 Tax=Abyssibacter sp. TaxID=2320200 RepID=UPI00321A34CD